MYTQIVSAERRYQLQSDEANRRVDALLEHLRVPEATWRLYSEMLTTVLKLFEDGAGVGRDRIERGRQVKDLIGRDAKRLGESGSVSAVGAGGQQGHDCRPFRRRTSGAATSAAARASVTSRLSRTAAAMSARSGGRPSPSGGRSSMRSP